MLFPLWMPAEAHPGGSLWGRVPESLGRLATGEVAAADGQASDDLEEKALSFIDQLSRGEYAEATAGFDNAMLQALPEERLQSIWEDLVKQYGGYRSTGKVERQAAGQYTAVIVETHFERADINLRVVFSAAGQISGFFYVPVHLSDGVSFWLIAAVGATALFTILYPFFLAALAHRRLAVPWRYFAFGAGIFLIFQVATRIPIVLVIEALLGQQIRATPWLLAGWIVLLCFTAGLFEETGRYVGYRWLMARDEKTWPMAVMFGLGHGGIESILLVGLSNLINFAVLLCYPLLQGILPGEIGGQLAQMVATISSYPNWYPLLAAWERLWTVPVHVALSVVVLQVFRRKQTRWLWLAILLHTAVNLVIVGLSTWIKLPGVDSALLSSALVLLAGAGAVWLALRLREKNIAEQPA